MVDKLTAVPRWLIAAMLGTLLLSVIAASGPGNAFAQDDATETPTTTEEAADDSVTAADAEFAAGDAVFVIDGPLNLRDAAGTGSDVLFSLEIGVELEITDGPISANDYTWYEVETPDGETGWVAGEFLGDESEVVVRAFAAGDAVVVADGPLNLREAAGTDADVVAEIDTGAPLEITDGPVSADDYSWYEVTTADDESGWVAGEFLGTGSDGSSDGEFAAGDAVVVNDGPLNVRDDSSIDGDIVSQMETGDAATILDGPVEADGYLWYQVETADGTSGWVAADFIGLADGGGTGDADFAVGDAVTATVQGTNFRADAGLDAAVIDLIDEGALFLIQDGPVVADGYTWFRVFNYYYGEGWVAGELMALDPDGFPIEDGA